MRIAFLILNLGAGGAERATTALSSAMAQKGHDVTIFALTGTESFYPTSEKVNVKFLNLPELPTGSGVRRVSATISRALALRKIIKQNRIDILIGMSHIMSAYAAFCCFGTKTKSIGTERANPYVLQNSTAMRIFRKVSSCLCDGFVAQTRKALTFFPKQVQKKAIVIPNAVFNPLVESCSVPKERKKEICAVGRLDENKGFDILIDAFSAVHPSHPEYTLTIHGEGPGRKDLENKISSLNLQDFIHLPGATNDAITKVSQSSVFVLSSRSEGMPNALIEAMAVGTPCVSTACDMGPSELIENEVNGILVPINNPEAMAEAITKIIDNKSLSDTLSANALHIRNTHSVGTITDSWLSYFGTVISS